MNAGFFTSDNHFLQVEVQMRNVTSPFRLKSLIAVLSHHVEKHCIQKKKRPVTEEKITKTS